MDPLSIVVSTIAIASVIKAAVQKARELGAAASGLHSLFNEISDLVVVLQSIEQSLRHYTQGPVLQQDAHFIHTIQLIQSRLQTIMPQIEHWIGGHLHKKSPVDPRRLNRIRLGSKVNRLKDEIRDLRLQLMTVLNAVAVTNFSQIKLGLQEVYWLAENSATIQDTVRHQLDANHTEQLRHLERISANVSDLPMREAEISLTPLIDSSNSSSNSTESHEEVGVSQTTSAKAFRHNGAILFESKQMTAVSAVGIRTAQFPRVACKPWCSCVCHKERSFRSPSFMEQLTGSLFVGCSGIPILRQKCNQESCHLESQPLMYVTYFFPAWFLARMISLMVSTTPLAGPVVSLKTQRTVPGDSEVFACAKTGNIDKMKYLFQNGLASPHDVSFQSGVTALHYAISYQQMDICTLLLQANADPFLEDRTRWTAADNAWGKILSGRFSLEKESQLRSMFSDTECLERWNFTVIHKIVLGLCSKDLEPELESSTAEIDFTDSNGRTAVSFAAERSDIKALSLLLRYGANPATASPNHGSPLHFAATAANPRSIDLLLEHGVEVDCVTSYFQTPLHYVAAYNNSEMHATALLAAGADPNFRDLDGMPPLHWTAISGNAAVAKVLLAHGANVDDTDNVGDSALMQSIRANRHEIISLLLLHSPDTRNILANGKTILHVIAADADLETIFLLRGFDLSGVDASVVASDGLTALQACRARETHNPELETAFDALLAGELTSEYVDEQPESEELWEDALETLVS